MKTIRAIILLLSISPLAEAQQNLVPNPSFEDTIECPTGSWSIMACKDWFGVYPANGDQHTNNNAVPDYFHSCSTQSGYDNYRGFQFPRSGAAYSDFMAYEQNNPNQRIYLECQLIHPLEKDKFYKVSFYVVLGNNYKYYTNTIGAYFSEVKQEKFNYLFLGVAPQVMSSNKIKDTANWTEITGNYKAKGGEKFLTLGNFFDDANSNLDTIPAPGGVLAVQAIYYVDDVSVTTCDTCKDDSVITVENNLFIPDAYSPNGDGNNDVLFVRGNNIQELYFAVYDRWGEKVFETKDKNMGWDGTFKGKALNSSVYVFYCIGKYTDGTEFKDKGDITLIK